MRMGVHKEPDTAKKPHLGWTTSDRVVDHPCSLGDNDLSGLQRQARIRGGFPPRFLALTASSSSSS